MATRTTGALALRPAGNAQGGYYFMSLTTGRRIARNHWTPLPMPQDVIDRVHVLARRQNVARGLEFLDRNNDPIDTLDGDDLDDDPEDPAYDPDEEPDDDLDEDELYDLPDDHIAGVIEHFNNDGAAALENANDENGEEIADFYGNGAGTR